MSISILQKREGSRWKRIFSARTDKDGPWTSVEKKPFFLMLVAIALWMTDLNHHISPAVIGIGVGLLAALPRIGVLDQEGLKRFNYLPVFLVAAPISMGEV